VKSWDAERGIDYRTEDFVRSDSRRDRGATASIITLDMVAGSLCTAAIWILPPSRARVVTISMLGGARAEINMNSILPKRLTLTGSTLAVAHRAQKAAVAEAMRRNVWPLLAAGRVKPVIHQTFPLAEACDAHRLMESSSHIGKIVLTL